MSPTASFCIAFFRIGLGLAFIISAINKNGWVMENPFTRFLLREMEMKENGIRLLYGGIGVLLILFGFSI